MNPIVTMLAEKLIEKLAPILVKQLSALLPVIAAAVAKAIADQIKTAVPLAVPALPDLAEQIRHTVNQIPDIDVPVLSDIFDLTEWAKKL